jgi:hypothetical protein
MKFLSKIFGSGSKKQADIVLREAFGKIQRIIDDEDFQLELMNPAIRDVLQSSPAYDRKPDGVGAFGFVETNPIPVNGPIGEIAYLSRLEAGAGKRLIFHRLGSIQMVDVFEAVTFDGGQWYILYLDMYHSRRSKLAPDGLRFTQEVAQFSGFCQYCKNFPYDFAEMKAAQQQSGLSLAYIPISKVSDSLQRRVFNRPIAHTAKLEILSQRLTRIDQL